MAVRLTPVQVILAAKAAGLELSLRDGRLAFRGHPDDELRRALHEHRERIAELLLIPSTSTPTVECLSWRAYDHVCHTGCQRQHVLCNACAQPLLPQWRHWPWLHGNCTLELHEAES
jgi:hypothetical protein